MERLSFLFFTCSFIIFLLTYYLAAPTFKVGLTAEEKQLYSQLFKSLDTESTGIVSGEKARSTFEKSGLPPTILGEIWQIADHNNLGFLTQFGFCLAMRLIGQTQGGNHPSPTLAETPGPLPKFVGLYIPPPSPATTPRPVLQLQPSNGSSFIQPISQQNTFQCDQISTVTYNDYQKFSSLFIKTVGNAGELSGFKAKEIFLKAKLPTQTLGQIWNLVDKDNLGKLSMSSFVVAMHLIHGVLSGSIKQLPPILPEAVWRSVDQYQQGQVAAPQPAPIQPSEGGLGSPRQASFAGSISSQQTTVRHPQSPPASREPSVSNTWVISPTLRQQYEAIFDNLDKSKVGVLNSEQVASVLMSSKLSQEDLATVWDLSDIQNSGNFSKLEFVIALFLVNKRLAGESLPNIVPDSLINSIKQQQQQIGQTSTSQDQTSVPAPAPAPISAPVQARSKTHMDDLVDVFGSSNSAPIQTTNLTGGATNSNTFSGLTPSNVRTPTTTGFGNAPSPVGRTPSLSDLTPTGTGDLPRVRKNLTGSFKPTSTFGQSLLHAPLESPHEDKEAEADSLLGDDHVASTAPPVKAPSEPVQKQHTVNYEALRSVPPPPPHTKEPARQSTLSPVPRQQVTQQQFQQPQHTSQQQAQQYSRDISNTDLLADAEVSGKLSQATSDIANVSNQIKSLATQTTGLQEKKIRAEQELAKILTLKKDIEGKLKSLRSSYDNEVKQVEQVEKNLITAKEETEALRSESSISEAKFNHLSTELNTKQISMEDLQKENSALKEKLGYLNAEIVEIEKQNASLANENQRLTNQLNVKKSQVQVSIVKSEELKNSVLELEESNRRLAEEYRQTEEEERRLDEEHKLLLQRHLDAQKSKPIAPPPPKQREPIPELPQVPDVPVVSKEVSHGAPVEAKEIEGPAPNESTHSTGSIAIGGIAAVAAVGSAIGTAAASVLTGDKKESEGVPSEEKAQKEPIEPSYYGGSTHSSVSGEPAGKPQLSEEAKSEVPVERDVSHSASAPVDLNTFSGHESVAGTSTTSDFHDNDGETPVTSPNNSDFQFPQGTNAGVVGGMVGMPGVLVGVQRTDSLTSSVQNNAALSVRDDNIDVSDRDTLENPGSEDVETTAKEIPHPPPARTRDAPSSVPHQDEGDKVSSGESFEMVNAEDATGHELPQYIKSVPPTTENGFDQEFPPIRELDIEESDSEDESDSDKFEDTVANLPEKEVASPKEQHPEPTINFDNAFDDLEPTSAENSVPKKEDDLFGNEFDGLEEAVPENDYDEFAMDNTFDFSENFTNNEQITSDFPDMGPTPAGNGAADEWEELFAGFGNAGSVQAPVSAPPQVSEHHTASTITPNDPGSSPLHAQVNELVQELCGMGFDDKTAYDALEREGWDLQAATNFLLDHA